MMPASSLKMGAIYYAETLVPSRLLVVISQTAVKSELTAIETSSGL